MRNTSSSGGLQPVAVAAAAIEMIVSANSSMRSSCSLRSERRTALAERPFFDYFSDCSTLTRLSVSLFFDGDDTRAAAAPFQVFTSEEWF